MLTTFRKEIKFVIPVEMFVAMEGELEAVMIRDHNGINGTYQVRSQYFDSIRNQDLMDNLDGVMEKRKIRTRIYSPDDQSAKLEYKCKSGTDGAKYSIIISRYEAIDLENENYSFLSKRPEEIARFLYLKMIQNVYHPTSIVEYSRTAFTYPVSDVRVTFDHNLRGSINPYGLFDQEPFYQPLFPQDLGVLEVKYNDFLVSPIKEILSSADILSSASSKYSQARMLNII